jgi:hypothetical protein
MSFLKVAHAIAVVHKHRSYCGLNILVFIQNKNMIFENSLFGHNTSRPPHHNFTIPRLTGAQGFIFFHRGNSPTALDNCGGVKLNPDAQNEVRKKLIRNLLA